MAATFWKMKYGWMSSTNSQSSTTNTQVPKKDRPICAAGSPKARELEAQVPSRVGVQVGLKTGDLFLSEKKKKTIWLWCALVFPP